MDEGKKELKIEEEGALGAHLQFAKDGEFTETFDVFLKDIEVKH